MKPLIHPHIVVIFLGICIYCLTMFFGNINMLTFLTAQRINGIIIWQFDLGTYLSSLSNAINNFPRLQFNMPNIGESTDVIELLRNLVNSAIGILNVLMYPIQVGAYTVKLVCSIVGIDFSPDITHNLTWLVDFINSAIEGNYIPYI